MLEKKKDEGSLLSPPPNWVRKSHEDIHKAGDTLDARQVADVLSENSNKKILANNVVDIARRHHLTIPRRVGGNNLYLYNEVRYLIIAHKAGRKRIGDEPLTGAEKMRRMRARRSAGSGSSSGPGGRGRSAAAGDDTGDQGDEKPRGLVLLHIVE